ALGWKGCSLLKDSPDFRSTFFKDLPSVFADRVGRALAPYVRSIPNIGSARPHARRDGPGPSRYPPPQSLQQDVPILLCGMDRILNRRRHSLVEFVEFPTSTGKPLFSVSRSISDAVDRLELPGFQHFRDGT